MNYKIYKLSIQEYIYGGTLFTFAAVFLSYLFYNSLWPLILIMPCIIFFFKILKGYLHKRQQQTITIEFKDMLISLSSLLSSGYSVENAISEVRREIFALHGSCIVYKELIGIEKQLQLNVPIEVAFSDFAYRTDIEIIHTFSQILSIAKQTGGNLKSIILATTSNISSQIDVRMEIASHLAGQQLELYIMAIMPPAIMIYIKLTNPGFFSPIYNNILGIVIMTICLMLYIASVYIAYKILSKIE